MSDKAGRAAKNEALFREVNERIKDLSDARADWTSVLCECSDPDCAMTIDVKLTEYEAVRGKGNRFALVVGHEDPTVERIVQRNERFLVAEKVGEAGEVARNLNPRS